MYRILIVSEDFVLRKAVAFSLNDLDACVECADTVGAMLVLHLSLIHISEPTRRS